MRKKILRFIYRISFWCWVCTGIAIAAETVFAVTIPGATYKTFVISMLVWGTFKFHFKKYLEGNNS